MPKPEQTREDDDWEHSRHQKPRFECLKCELNRTTSLYAFGDEAVWRHTPDFDA